MELALFGGGGSELEIDGFNHIENLHRKPVAYAWKFYSIFV